jgi:D-threo-aldose 1-dehydrogenase
MRSIEDSLQRLGMSRIDIALIHDVDPMHQGAGYDDRFAEASNGACRALAALKTQGVIGAWGIGVNEVGPCLRFGRDTGLDCVMLLAPTPCWNRPASPSFSTSPPRWISRC